MKAFCFLILMLIGAVRAEAGPFFFHTLGKINYPIIVQKKSSYGTGVPITATFDNPVTTGNMLLACFSWDWGGAVSISDNRTNSWVQDFYYAGDGNNWAGFACYRVNAPAAGATTVSFTAPNGGNTIMKHLLILEVSGLTTSSPFDKSNRVTGTGTTLTPTTTAVAQSCEYVFAYATDWNNKNTYSVSSGYRIQELVHLDTGQYYTVFADKDVRTGLSGNQSVTVTRSAGSGQWQAVIMTYKCP